MHEDVARLARQRLIALEDGRDADAEVLQKFIEEEFGETITDVAVEDVPENLYYRWQEVYGLPGSVEMLTVVVSAAREPVWRIPTDLETRGVSWFEVPLHLQEQDWLQEDDQEALPEHLRKREAGDLPKKVDETIRLPESEEEA